jgi:hypothetical protein
MIHRAYVVQLDQGNGQSYPPCDIIVSLPGTPAAPVTNPAVFPPGTPLTPAPSAWVAACTQAHAVTAVYYEIRGRALRIEKTFGQAGFVPRTNLGFHLSVCTLSAASGGQFNAANSLPMLSLSASLAVGPGAAAVFSGGSGYGPALADPSYGPVIRVWNSSILHSEADPIFLVNLAIAENKDEDFQALGHA